MKKTNLLSCSTAKTLKKEGSDMKANDGGKEGCMQSM